MKCGWLGVSAERIESRCGERATWMINWSGVEDYCRDTFLCLREACCLCEELWDSKVKQNIRFTCCSNYSLFYKSLIPTQDSTCWMHRAKPGRCLPDLWNSLTNILKHQSQASITLTWAVSLLLFFFFFHCWDKPLKVAKKKNEITNPFIRLYECETQGEPVTACIRWC